MIALANALLLGGLAAAVAPVVVHIAHRRRFRTVEWGAMRFLAELLSRQRRRMSLDHLLLLAVRMLAIAAVALALTRPQFTIRAEGLGDLIARSGRTSAVILIDDSLSTSAPRGEPAFTAIKKLVAAYLDTLKAGDEVSIVVLSRLGEPAGDPLYDLAGARELVDRLQPTAVASDMPTLVDAGLDRLARHLNPEAELVIASDGRAEGFAVAAKSRWDSLRVRLLGPTNAAPGTRSRPHVIILGPRAEHAQGNLSVTAITIDRTLLPPGRPVTITATIGKEGTQPVSGALARLLVNGRAVDEKPLDIPGNQVRELSFRHAFTEPGSYLVDVVAEGARDALSEDDHRLLAVQVESRLPVLLVEGRPTKGLDGSLGLLAAALAPGVAADSGGAVPGELFAVTRVGATAVGGPALEEARVVVIGDVAALDAGTVSALERFVVGGGGIFVVLGPNTDRDLANRFWARGGDGFLPAELGPVVTAPGRQPVTASAHHPALAPFADQGPDVWRDVSVTRCISLASTPPELDRLIALDHGEPLLVTRGRGRGRVAMLTTTLDGSWNDLPYRGAFVPLVRSLTAWLGGNILPPRNLLAGERLAWFPGAAAALGANITAEGPDGQPLALQRSAWEGHPALISGPLSQPGAYAVHEPAGHVVTWYAVGTDPAESRLAALSDTQLDEILAKVPRHVVSDPKQVSGLFTSAGNRTFELWRPLIALCVALLILETLLCRLQTRSERTDSAAAGRAA